MFPITITIHDQAQFDAVRIALLTPGKEPAPTPKPAAAPAAAPGPATAQAAADVAPEKTANVSAPAAASADPGASPSTVVTDEKITYEQVKPLILELTKAKGRDVAAGALSKFGAAKGPELKPESYAEFVAHAKELLAKELLAKVAA